MVSDARLTGEWAERSIAGQIEFWARIGRALERVLPLSKVAMLKQKGAEKPLSECLRQVDSPEGRKRLGEVLKQRPFPHYEPRPGHPGELVRIDEDGTRTAGRFVNRRFVAVQD